MLAELVDAVIGVDTHRDTHQVEVRHEVACGEWTPLERGSAVSR